MTDVGAGIFFITLFFWVPAVWVFFDAQERGHSAYLWGALTLMFSLAALVVYFAVRAGRGRREAGSTYSRGRIYLHVAAITFWGLAAVGVTVALYGVLQRVGASEDTSFLGTSLAERDRTLREALAFGIALLVICLPATALHLVLIRRQVLRSAGDERLALARLQSGLFSLLTVIGGLIAFSAFAAAVFGVTALAFDVEGQIGRDGWSAILPMLAISSLSLALATALFWLDEDFQAGRRELSAARASAAQSGAMPPQPVAEARPRTATASSGAGFCSQCGAALMSGARFCSACGAAVATPSAS
jgi:hypothetical protein